MKLYNRTHTVTEGHETWRYNHQVTDSLVAVVTYSRFTGFLSVKNGASTFIVWSTIVPPSERETNLGHYQRQAERVVYSF